ncbi:hypothetical protein HHL17_18505 [Chitinophaga sp. G-6-1-13]|uniref:Abortive infection protein n=1 Tax=Chitinophaga fulva TaxID=2728842 RepID=A0A848GTV9_9BACT|nr:hypothetical protein [Chitinophaga fulva]NML39198.1 hypothetical protein [Chitinophaga fulva]
MRIKGITYDTGFINLGVSTKEKFEPAVVMQEMQIIKSELHCNAVRVTGGDADRLEITARLAASVGLEVWYSPFTCGLTIDELVSFLLDCAERAERLRREGAAVVFLAGSEISLFNAGFFAAATLDERLDLFKDAVKLRNEIPPVQSRIRIFFDELVPLVREKFGGLVSYASIPLEFSAIDWDLFDFIATDAGYRSADIAPAFLPGLRRLMQMKKPLAITEFGCVTMRGGADMGAHGGELIDWANARPRKIKGNHIRDEGEQAAHIKELFDIFAAEKVDAVFLCTFAQYNLPHRQEPEHDLDMASYGIVKVYEEESGQTYPGLPWEPKVAFHTLATCYGNK